MDNEIKVSINCMAYNHGKYIAQCLDGFLMQKTNFKYVILVHDDASTDNTAEIIKEYEKKYPDIIKAVYQTENQSPKGNFAVETLQVLRGEGKYMAFCEGDDYWSDENKLQIQYDLMEAHPECSACTHTVEKFDDRTGEVMSNIPYPYIGINEDKIIYADDYLIGLSKGYVFQTSSFFCKTADIIEYYSDLPEFRKVSLVGDIPMMLYSLTKGGIWYINKVMSRYRQGQAANWSKINNNPAADAKFKITSANMFDEYNKFTDYKYNDSILVSRNQCLHWYYSLCEINGLEMQRKAEIKKILSGKQKRRVAWLKFRKKVKHLLLRK